jgi:acetoin utilization deacetylase AcuC-like enzyme
VLIQRFLDSNLWTGELLHNIDQKDDLCIDTYTPLNNKLCRGLEAPLSSANEAVCQYLQGYNVYALTRPPGHHSSESKYGGYSYYNYTALAAQALSKHGRVAILDIDFHHGNGTQDIFYKRADVLTISIHGDPQKHFPHTGYEDEIGKCQGVGFNKNFILADRANIDKYRKVLLEALEEMKQFNPAYVIIPFGADTYIGDPLGAFSIETADYKEIAQLISQYFQSFLVIQEGGYNVDDLGRNVVSFLSGFCLSQ